MDIVKATYIVCSMIESLFLISLAVAAPIWITPGYYWWTALALFLIGSSGNAFGKRLNSWGGMGNNNE